MNDMPPPSPCALKRARRAIDVAIVLAGVGTAFAASRHSSPALVTIAVALFVAVTAFVVITRGTSR